MQKVKLSEIEYGIIGIYKIDFPNGKSYVGQSKDIKSRIMRHNNIRNYPEIVVEKAIGKYGIIEEFYILEETSIENLNNREQYWIEYYDLNNREKGYNIAEGGNGAKVPRKFTEEQAIEIANIIKNNKTIRFEELAQKYNCSLGTIQKINQGSNGYRFAQFTYPIRTTDESRVLRAVLDDNIIQSILNDLKNTNMTMVEIGEKYNLCRNTISDINKGKKQPQKIIFIQQEKQKEVKFKHGLNIDSPAELNMKERFYIDLYKSVAFGYNSQAGNK